MSSQTIWPATFVNVAAPVNPADWCAEVLDRFDALGIAERFAAFATTAERVEELARANAATRIDLRDAVTDAARRLASGELTIPQAGEEVAQAERDDRAAEMSRKVLASAIGQAGSKAVAALAAEGDAIVTDTLRPLLASLVDEWTDLAGTIPADVTSDADAMHAPTKVRDAWARLLDLERRAGLIWSTGDTLRNAGAIPVPRQLNRGVRVGEFRWHRPDLLTHAPRDHRPHPVDALTAAIASGAGPDVLTGAEVLDRHQSQEAA